MNSTHLFLILLTLSAFIAAVWKSQTISPEDFLETSSQQHRRTNIDSIPNNTTEVNILDWFTDNKEEFIHPITLSLEGASETIPSYVIGSLVRNGPTIWTAGDEYYGHLFDGASRLTKFTINGATQIVQFSSRLLESEVLDSILKKNKLKPAVSVGPILHQDDNTPVIGGPLRISVNLFNTFLIYDNCVVNVWDYDPTSASNKSTSDRSIWAITDTASTARVNLETLATTERGRPPRGASGCSGFEFLLTAHPDYDKTGTGATYNINAEITLGGIRLNLVRETEALTKRKIVASLSSFDDCFLPFVGGMPYVHSFGLTPTRALILINPIRLPVFDIPGLLEKGFLRASTESDQTLLWVVELSTGKSKVVEVPEPIYYYHTISATDEEDGIHSSIRLIGKSDSSYIVQDNHFLRMDKVVTPGGRNQAAKQGAIVQIRTDGESTATVKWFPSNQVVGFEYPTHKYSRVINGVGPWQSFQHPRYVYGTCSFCGSAYFDQWCLVKVDTEETTHDGLYHTLFHRDASHYYSEPIFVPNPAGTAEDDGVLLSRVYDGVRRESYLLILNARTMEPVSKAYTGTRIPVDFHGAFFA